MLKIRGRVRTMAAPQRGSLTGLLPTDTGLIFLGGRILECWIHLVFSAGRAAGPHPAGGNVAVARKDYGPNGGSFA